MHKRENPGGAAGASAIIRTWNVTDNTRGQQNQQALAANINAEWIIERIPSMGWAAEHLDECLPGIFAGRQTQRAEALLDLSCLLGMDRAHIFFDIAAELYGDGLINANLMARAMGDAWVSGKAGSLLMRAHERETLLWWMNEVGTVGMMTPAERRYWRRLQKRRTITLYRGGRTECPEDLLMGLSWTLDRKVADFFAFQYRFNEAFDGTPTVIAVEVPGTAAVAEAWLNPMPKGGANG